jgi:HD-GYP domain-containing protein (c-di-GMP phosphodiesterase class II)
MFSVVDVYGGLSSDRPYCSAWPKEMVIEYIKEQSGKYFDPSISGSTTENHPMLTI